MAMAVPDKVRGSFIAKITLHRRQDDADTLSVSGFRKRRILRIVLADFRLSRTGFPARSRARHRPCPNPQSSRQGDSPARIKASFCVIMAASPLKMLYPCAALPFALDGAMTKPLPFPCDCPRALSATRHKT